MFEGALGVLMPTAALLNSADMAWWDLTSLLSLLTSMYSVFDEVGCALEVTGAMASQELVPFPNSKKTNSSVEPLVAPPRDRFFPRVHGIEHRIQPIENRTDHDPN